MGKKAKCMRYDLKISLSFYKIIYSVVFMVIIIFIRGISTSGEVIAALEPNAALLAGVFMADNYYKEFANGNIQVFYRYSLKKKTIAMVRRSLIDIIYLLLLVLGAYWGYLIIYHPLGFSYDNNVSIMFHTLTACAISIFFFGMLSFTITNFTQKIGVGIGVSVIIWVCLSSSFAEYLPTFLKLFFLEENNQQLGIYTPYYTSRFCYLFIALSLAVSNICSLRKAPKYNKKGMVFKHGNRN